MENNGIILKAHNLSKDFSVERGFFKKEAGLVRALDNVSFSAELFKTLGIVGESGSGKTTLAKIILRLIAPSSGEIDFNPQHIKAFRKDVQIIFQNPYASLNPKMRILDALAEPLIIHRMAEGVKLKEECARLIDLVGLDEDCLNRYPIEFSGGQRQRICIARALASEPKLLVLDEPISSLDLTLQAQMLDLFIRLKSKLNLTYLFISHNLAVIRHIADAVLVMREGRVVEQGSSKEIFAGPKEEYTKLLLAAARG